MDDKHSEKECAANAHLSDDHDKPPHECIGGSPKHPHSNIMPPWMIKDFNGPFQLPGMELESSGHAPKLERNSNPIKLHHEVTRLAGIDTDEERFYTLMPKHTVRHPAFSEPIDIGTPENLASFWDCAGEIDPDFEEPANYWMKKVERRKYDKILLEDRVNAYCDDPDILKMAGIISASESETMSRYRPDLRVLQALMSSGNLPPNIELVFLGGHLCINSVPTVIFEQDIRDLYNGYLAFRDPETSIQHVIELVEEKLLPLFGE